jgi:membrane fusion protein (multidrug efflux system)
MVNRIFFLLLLAALGAGGYVYWERSTHVRSTDNAYVNAEVAQISGLVAGRVIAMHVKDNQFVKKGEPLFDVDPAPYRVAVEKARAQVALARQGSTQDSAEVRALEAELARQSAELDNAEVIKTRTENLVAKGFMSRQAVDDAASKVISGRAAVEQAKARIEKARVMIAPADSSSPAVASAQATLAQAQLDLDRTRVSAPQSGWVVNRTLTSGTSVNPGQTLFAIIADKSFWVDANFKETELPGVHPGMPVEIQVDMYPGHKFEGRVESIGGGTGTAFSLLPPQNATGNWVKVAQRIPVKVRFDNYDPLFMPRVGATASVTIRLD